MQGALPAALRAARAAPAPLVVALHDDHAALLPHVLLEPLGGGVVPEHRVVRVYLEALKPGPFTLHYFHQPLSHQLN